MFAAPMMRIAAPVAVLALSLSSLSPAATGDAPRFVTVPGTAVVLKLWEGPDTTGRRAPHYAISLDGAEFSTPRTTSYDLKLSHGGFDPLADADAGAPAIEAGFEAGADTNLHIVQYATQPLEAYRDAVHEAGGEVLAFLANHAQVIRMDPNAAAIVEALPFVRWVGPFHPAYRLDRVILDEFMVEGGDLGYRRYHLHVTRPGEDEKQIVAERIRALGGIVEKLTPHGHLMGATLSPDALVEIVRMDEVLYVDRWLPTTTYMNNVRSDGGANAVEVVAGYTGAGVRGEVMDSGLLTSHEAFQHDPAIIHGANSSNTSHGTSVYGICFGDGTGSADGRGMLPDGQGVFSAWNSFSDRYVHTMEIVQAFDAVFQTNSWGSCCTTQYGTESAYMDLMIFDSDLLILQAQANSGSTSSDVSAWAKNVVSVGGIEHDDTLTRADDHWTFAGSIGPAADGRVKPDLAFWYDSIRTTSNSGGYTSGFGGTSAATPETAGHFGLMFQMWSDGIFGNEVVPGQTVFENRPHMATAKALMVNTAEPYDFSGTTHDLTRTHQGWGLPNVGNLYDLREKMLVVDEVDLLVNLQSIEYLVAVASDEPRLKATLVFNDPPGNPASSQARINDLSLKLTSPSGTVYWGNNGLLVGNVSSPGGLPNDIDTVENVWIEDPEPGVWTVEVIAHEIIEDAHVETPQLDADFALVVSGGEQGPGFGIAADVSEQSVCAPAVAEFDVTVEQFMDYTEAVTFSATGAPPGTTVSFTVNPVTPPGTTTLMISDTDLAAAGSYLIEITGTSIDMERTTHGTLDLSTSVPGAATLTSPANGETNVGRLPTLVWDAATQGAVYEVEISTNPGFAPLTYSATVTGTSHTVATNLDLGTAYFWRLRSTNACGVGPDSGAFGFTVIDQLDYFTEEIDAGDMDLENLTLSFVPDGTADFYDACLTPITELPIDPAGGVVVVPGDDSSTLITIFGPPIVLYGTPYPNFYLNSNGHITFGAPDSDPAPTLTKHFSIPRISALYNNLDPGTQGIGDVSYKTLGDRVVVTFEGATESGLVNSSTFQIEMHYTGEIRISYLEVEVTQVAIVGLSDGTGLPVDFLGTDASATPECAGLCVADLDGSGDVGFGDILTIIGAWGPCGVPCPEDLSGNGQVDFADILEVIAAWGDCP
ncbi:MAG: S8 family serine peptidase [Planctomycetes bacterium]|nr:S8 family serine peptidase [Planctomycetota bacterium]